MDLHFTQRASASAPRRAAVLHAGPTTKTSSHVVPDSATTLTYSPNLKIIFPILYDSHSQQPFEDHEPRASPSAKKTSIYLCTYQRDHMLAAVKAYNWPCSIVTRFSGDDGLELFEARLTVLRKEPSFPRPQNQEISSKKAVCFTVCLSRSGDLDVVYLPRNIELGILFPDKVGLFGTKNIQTPNGLQPIQVHVDSETHVISTSTCHNTIRRVHFTAAAHTRVTSSLPTTTRSDVLLVNNYDEIMDGIACTPYFFRSGRWVTPSDTSGGRRTATRRWALTQNLCDEGEVLCSELKNGEMCRLSCDARGFFYGTICLSRTASNPPSENEGIELVNLEANQGLKQESICEDDETLITNEFLGMLHSSSRHSPRHSSLASLPSTSSKSAQSSTSASPSPSEPESSVDSTEGEAEYEPDEEVPSRRRRRRFLRSSRKRGLDEEVPSGRRHMHSKMRRVSPISALGSDTDTDDEPDYELASRPTPLRRSGGAQNSRSRRRRRTLRQVERYGT